MAAKKYYSSYQGVPIACWRDIVFNLLNAISVGACFFLSLYFVDELHLGIAMAGLLMSSYGTGTVLGGILSGKLCDKISPHLILVISLFLQGAAFFLLANLNSITLLVFTLFTLGVSTYSFKTANNISMLSHCHGDQGLHLKTINISHAASNFGLGISGIAVGLLTTLGYSIIFYSAGAILLISSLYQLIFNEQSPQLEVDYHAKQSTIETRNYSGKRNINILILVLTSVFFIGLIIAQLGSTYPIYVEKSFPKLGTKAVSILFILDTVLIVLFQAPLANYYNKYNTVIVMGLGAFLMGLGMLVLSLSSTFMLAIISCCIWTTGEMLFVPTAQLLCYENAESRKKGQSMGIFQSTFAISTVAGPTIGGYVYSTISPDAMWYLSIIIGVSCLLSCVIFTNDKKSSFFPANTHTPS